MIRKYIPFFIDVIAELSQIKSLKKTVLYPYNSQSEQVYKNNGFVILTPSEYLQSKAK